MCWINVCASKVRLRLGITQDKYFQQKHLWQSGVIKTLPGTAQLRGQKRRREKKQWREPGQQVSKSPKEPTSALETPGFQTLEPPRSLSCLPPNDT